jgi:hypothetical protein
VKRRHEGKKVRPCPRVPKCPDPAVHPQGEQNPTSSTRGAQGLKIQLPAGEEEEEKENEDDEADELRQRSGTRPLVVPCLACIGSLALIVREASCTMMPELSWIRSGDASPSWEAGSESARPASRMKTM